MNGMRQLAGVGCAMALFLASASSSALGASMPDDGEKPTLFLIGDSTVKNGRGDGAGGLWGWGDFIAAHFDTNRIRVVNRALGGRSSRTHLTGGLWYSIATDDTHTTAKDARINAASVVEGIRGLKDCPLSEFLVVDVGPVRPPEPGGSRN